MRIASLNGRKSLLNCTYKLKFIRLLKFSCIVYHQSSMLLLTYILYWQCSLFFQFFIFNIRVNCKFIFIPKLKAVVTLTISPFASENTFYIYSHHVLKITKQRCDTTHLCTRKWQLTSSNPRFSQFTINVTRAFYFNTMDN